MNPFDLIRHLEQVHRVEEVGHLDAQTANMRHLWEHNHRAQHHSHSWAGYLADPQGPIASRS